VRPGRVLARVLGRQPKTHEAGIRVEIEHHRFHRVGAAHGATDAADGEVPPAELSERCQTRRTRRRDSGSGRRVLGERGRGSGDDGEHGQGAYDRQGLPWTTNPTTTSVTSRLSRRTTPSNVSRNAPPGPSKKAS